MSSHAADWPRTDDALQSVGRASYVASRFDQDFSTLVTFLELPDHWNEYRTWEADQRQEFTDRIARRRLAHRQKQAADAAEADNQAFEILRSARVARNELLHAMPRIPLQRLRVLDREQRRFVTSAPPALLETPLMRLRELVLHLASGAALVGSWLFQMLEQHEEHPFPGTFADAYPAALTQWVLAPVWDLLPRLPGEPTQPRSDGAVWELPTDGSSRS